LLSKFNFIGLSLKGSLSGIQFPSAPATRVAASLLLLAAQVLTRRAASYFVRVNMLVKRLMTDWQFA
jgi:hypothetical protein